MPRGLAFVALVAFAGGLGASVIAQSPTPPAQSLPAEIDRVVAIVNDEAVTLSELRHRTVQTESQLRQRNIELPPRDALEKQLLERLILERVQLQLARDTGLQVDDAALDAALARIAEGNRVTLAEMRTAIERDGIPWSRFRDDIRKEMLLSRLREREVTNRIVVTDAEVDNLLSNPGTPQAGEWLVEHILIRVPEQASPTELDRIQARMQEAIAQINKGEPFAKVAATYSQAPDANNGGSLGWRPVERLPNLYVDAGKALKTGELSRILRSPAGLHVIRITDRRGGNNLVDNTPVDQFHVRHILLRDTEVKSDDEARRRLMEIKQRVTHGADFAELARLHSNDLSAAKGGDLGWVYAGDTVREFEQAVRSLKPGEISDPVQTQFGWHLIQLIERRTDSVSSERRRQVARQILRERKADEAYEDWLRQLRDRAYVELRLEER
ncbi:MAG: hypothetical protein AMXMBFR6_00510 [Betaproteobacteria bacterium]